MVAPAMKELTPKELAKLPWAQQQAYHLQHGPKPTSEYQAFTDAKARIGGLLAITTAYAIQFGGMCNDNESVAWAGKVMVYARNVTDRIREAVTADEMVAAVQNFAKECQLDKVDNPACNAIEGAVAEIIAVAEEMAGELPTEEIAGPVLETRGNRAPVRGGPPIGGRGTAEELRNNAAKSRGEATEAAGVQLKELAERSKRMEEEAQAEVDAAESALNRKEEATRLRKQFEEETAAEEKKLADLKAAAEKPAPELTAAEKKAAEKKAAADKKAGK